MSSDRRASDPPATDPPDGDPPRVVALAGGVGAARFLRGLVRAVDPRALTVVGNVADDLQVHGLHVSPDLDTITYTLGGGIDEDRGWGRAGDTTVVLDELAQRYGHEPWFRLGDRDLATHLHRTARLRSGATLSTVTAELAASWQVPGTLRPVTDDPLVTRIGVADGRELHFQEWWVGERAAPEPVAVRFAGAQDALPAPGVLAAITSADVVVLCPSNPVVSLGPILAVPGVRAALRSAPVVGVSPIVGGRVLRGMADRLLPLWDCDVDAAAVAGLYADLLDAWVLDTADADRAAAVANLGVTPVVAEAVMRDVPTAQALADTVLAAVLTR